MFTNGFCGTGSWGLPGYFGTWSWIGLILNLVFGIGLLAGLTLLVIWAVRRTRIPAAIGPDATGHLSAKENLQVQYARGEITREEYDQMRQDLEG